MDSQDRMLKVLGWLVVSMTVGSFVLSVLEPEPGKAIVSAQRFTQNARLAVGSCRTPIRPWQAIEIVPVVGPSAGSFSLTATRNSAGVHFTVTAAGAIVTGESWRNQDVLAGTDGIRIGLEASRPDAPPTAAQSTALIALLDALHLEMAAGAASPSLPVTLAGWDQQSPFAGALEHLLVPQPLHS